MDPGGVSHHHLSVFDTAPAVRLAAQQFVGLLHALNTGPGEGLKLVTGVTVAKANIHDDAPFCSDADDRGLLLVVRNRTRGASRANDSRTERYIPSR